MHPTYLKNQTTSNSAGSKQCTRKLWFCYWAWGKNHMHAYTVTLYVQSVKHVKNGSVYFSIHCKHWLNIATKQFSFSFTVSLWEKMPETYAQKNNYSNVELTSQTGWNAWFPVLRYFEKDQTRKEENTHLNFSMWSHQRLHEWSPLDLHARWGQTRPRLLCSWSPGTGACSQPVTASPVASMRHWWWQPCRVRKGQGCVAREPGQWRCLCGWAAWSWRCPGTAGSWTPCKTPGALFFSLLLQRQMVYMYMWQTPDISLFHP